jgi:Ca2+-binding RTX toxin-like protein
MTVSLAMSMSLVPLRADAAMVTNGGFEGGTFAGWTVENLGGSGGSWFVYSGTLVPLSGRSVDPPPEGRFAAITDQTQAGSHALYQDVVLEVGLTHTLSFILYYENANQIFNTPDTLEYLIGFPFFNTQYRVDVMKPSASTFSVAPGDVLATVFRTKEGDPARLGPTRLTFDLTPFAGTMVRVRFAVAGNQSFFHTGVDSVTITSGDVCATGLTPTMRGTAGDDTLVGGIGADIIFGYGGNDRIFGGGGDDVICGGEGDDSVSGDDGDDRLYGEGGADSLSGGGGNDMILGGVGNDRLAGGPGVDELAGDTGDDALAALDGAGGDLLHGGSHVSGDRCAADPGDIVSDCNP